MTRGYVEVFKGRGVQPYRYRVVSANGEKLCTSEGYPTPSNARRAARRLVAMKFGRVIDRIPPRRSQVG